MEACVKDEVRGWGSKELVGEKKNMTVCYRGIILRKDTDTEKEKGRFRSELSFGPLVALLWASGYTSVMN